MRLSLSVRVLVGMAAVLLLYAGTVAFALWRVDKIRLDLRYTADNHVALARNLAQVKTLLDIRDEYTERALAEADGRARDYLVRYARDFYPLAIRARMTEARGAVQRALERSPSETETRFLLDAQERLHRTEDGEAATEETLAELFDRQDLTEAERTALRDKLRDKGRVLVREARLLSLNLDERVVQAVLRAERDERDAAYALLALGGLALVLGALVTAWVTRSLSPLRALREGAHALAHGQYDVEVPASAPDELASLAAELRSLGQTLREREGALARGTEELQRLKAFLEGVLASARVSILVTDGQLKVRRLNPAARSTFQVGISEVEGRDLRDLPVWALLSPHEDALRRAASGGDGLHLTAVPLPRPNARELTLDIDVEPLRDSRGASAVPGMVVVCTDVTERETARERLTATERLAAAGHLAAQVAHEIRNPLSSIGLTCELLEDELGAVTGPRAPEVQKLLRSIGTEIDRLAQLTEGYLKHARAGRGQVVAVDLWGAVGDLTTLVRDDLRRRGIALTVLAQPDAGRVRSDPARLRQVLLNLVRNAGEAVQGRANAQVQLSVSRQGNRTLVTVDDNGPGVPVEQRERIFEAFFTTKESGSGLGLSGSRAAMEVHGGALTCGTSPLGGARFVAAFVTADGTEAAEPVEAVADA
jgi:PAS domain S-box-containing protein